MLSPAVSAYTSVLFSDAKHSVSFYDEIAQAVYEKSVLHVYFSAHSYAVNTF